VSPTDPIRLNLFFEALSDADYERVRPLLVRRTWRKGSTILGSDDPHEGLFLIETGRVWVSKRTSVGGETLLSLLHAGDYFGESELLDGRPRMSNAVALDETVTVEVPKPEFERIISASPQAAQRLAQVLSVRLRGLSQHFVRQVERLGEHHAHEIEKLRRLSEASTIVNSTLHLDRLLGIMLDTAREIVDADGGTVYIVDEAKQELWSKVMQGSDLVEIRLPLGRGIAGYVGSTGEPLLIDDAYLDPRFNPEFDTKTGYRTRTILCVPIKNKDDRTIGVLQLLNKHDGVFTTDDLELIRSLSVHGAIALENARLYALERQSIAMEKELNAAHNVQMSLLPQESPRIKGYDIVGRTKPAQWVGGDYFDFIPMNEGRTALCLGDVTGKGLPAALLMANIQAILRSQWMVGPTPRRIMQRTNKLLRQSIQEGKFVTLFYGIIDAERHWMVFTNAGHENPMLVKPDGSVRRLSAGGTVLGILDDLFFEEDVVSLEPGDMVVMFSDGVTEAANAQNQLFGDKRLEAVVVEHRHLGSAAMADAIEHSIHSFAGDEPMRDDVTLLVVRREKS
jgi:sigma-B regulation protein RsbU (phosphoserine phosphatase)